MYVFVMCLTIACLSVSAFIDLQGITHTSGMLLVYVPHGVHTQQGGGPLPGGPPPQQQTLSLRFQGFLLLGRELGNADARGCSHEGEEDGDPVGDRPGHVGQGGDVQGAGHVGARRRPRQDGLPHGGRVLDGSRQVLRVQAPWSSAVIEVLRDSASLTVRGAAFRVLDALVDDPAAFLS